MNNFIISECATLKYLEQLDIPTPRVHGYGLYKDPKNTVGMTYILMDEMPGTPLLWKTPNADQENKVFAAYARMLQAFENHPFDQIGSLTYDADDNIIVGPVASDRTVILAKIGPYNSAIEFYKSWCEEHMILVADRQLFIAYSINVYLIFDYMKRQVGARVLN